MLYNGIGSGINNGLRQTAKQPAAWAALLSSVNPAVFIIGVLGIAALACYDSAKRGKKAENKPLPTAIKAPSQQPQSRSATAKSTAEASTKPLEIAALAAAEAAKTNRHERLEAVEKAVDPLSDEDYRREILRQHMSALGKKSAAARARKREGNALLNAE